MNKKFQAKHPHGELKERRQPKNKNGESQKVWESCSNSTISGRAYMEYSTILEMEKLTRSGVLYRDFFLNLDLLGS